MVVMFPRMYLHQNEWKKDLLFISNLLLFQFFVIHSTTLLPALVDCKKDKAFTQIVYYILILQGIEPWRHYHVWLATLILHKGNFFSVKSTFWPSNLSVVTSNTGVKSLPDVPPTRCVQTIHVRPHAHGHWWLAFNTISLKPTVIRNYLPKSLPVWSKSTHTLWITYPNPFIRKTIFQLSYLQSALKWVHWTGWMSLNFHYYSPSPVNHFTENWCSFDRP